MPSPDFWKKLESHHAADFRIRLRPAANIIGFAVFPIGWTCTEYKAIADDDSKPYEVAWIDHRSSGTLQSGAASERGIAAQKCAARFRRNEVEGILRRLVGRQEVKVYFGKHLHPQNPELYDPPEPNLGNPFDQHDFEKLDVKNSVAGARLYSKREIWIDAVDLINCLDKDNEKRGRKSKSNWLGIERAVRCRFESQGTGETNAQLERLFLSDDKLDTSAETPRRETFRQLLKTLRSEYGSAK